LNFALKEVRTENHDECGKKKKKKEKDNES